MSISEEELLQAFAFVHGAAQGWSGLEADEVTLETDIYGDMDLDSLDFVEFVMDIEDAAGFHFPSYPQSPSFEQYFIDPEADPLAASEWVHLSNALEGKSAVGTAWTSYREGTTDAFRGLLQQFGFSSYATTRLEQARGLATQYGMRPTSLGFMAFCLAELTKQRRLPDPG